MCRLSTDVGVDVERQQDVDDKLEDVREPEEAEPACRSTHFTFDLSLVRVLDSNVPTVNAHRCLVEIG